MDREGNFTVLRIILVIVLVAVDRFTKFIIREYIDLGQSIHVTSFFRITHIENTGMAFGFFRGMNLVLIFIVITIMAALIILTKRIVTYAGSLSRVSIMLILGGALGNFVDRIFYGRITDFLDFGIGRYRFPAFNFADSCVTVGGTLLAIIFLTRKDAGTAADLKDNGKDI
jgi:signal peptidase II